jgi:hypothetical protein
MVNTSSSSTLTSTLIHVRACVRDLNCASLTEEHIALLHQIASFACANAQEARFAQAADAAFLEFGEAEEDAREWAQAFAHERQMAL